MKKMLAKMQELDKPTKKLNESASMNISMTGDNSAEVGNLLKLLKDAGLNQADVVKPDMMPMRHDMEKFRGIVDGPASGPDYANEPDEFVMGLDSVTTNAGGGVNGPKHPADLRVKDPSMAHDIERIEQEDYANEPDEEFANVQTMTKDLAGGINGEKKMYAKAQDGDNPMSVKEGGTDYDSLANTFDREGIEGLAKALGKSEDEVSREFDNIAAQTGMHPDDDMQDIAYQYIDSVAGETEAQSSLEKTIKEKLLAALEARGKDEPAEPDAKKAAMRKRIEKHQSRSKDDYWDDEPKSKVKKMGGKYGTSYDAGDDE